VVSYNPAAATANVELDTGDDVLDVNLARLKLLQHHAGDIVVCRVGAVADAEWVLGKVTARLPFNLYNILLQETTPPREVLRVRPVLIKPGGDRVKRDKYKRKEGEESSCQQQ
jgi:hypothetical protein